MGEYLHSKDKRRVINALFKCLKYRYKDISGSGGIKESDIHMLGEANKLRYYPIMIWMRAQQDILEKRVSKRIDDMIDKQNGLEEAFQVFDQFAPEDLDFEKGILQAIGYKEFYPFYTIYRERHHSDYLQSLGTAGFDEEEKAMLVSCK